MKSPMPENSTISSDISLVRFLLKPLMPDLLLANLRNLLWQEPHILA